MLNTLCKKFYDHNWNWILMTDGCTFANKSLGKSMFPLEAVAGIALRNDTIP